MPSIYNKDGLTIEMRPKENGHNEPHVHALSCGKDVSIDLYGRVIVGQISSKHQGVACKWVADNSVFLQRLWREMHGDV